MGFGVGCCGYVDADVESDVGGDAVEVAVVGCEMDVVFVGVEMGGYECSGVESVFCVLML